MGGFFKEKRMKIAEVWYSKEGECPHCHEVINIEGDMGDEEICNSCGEEFEVGEFIL